jgi:serine protease Do
MEKSHTPDQPKDVTVDQSTEEPKTVNHPVVTQPRRKRFIAIAILVLLAILGVGYGGMRFSEVLKNNPQLTQHQTVANDGNKIIRQQEADISGVVEKVSPSVVSIVTEVQTEGFRGVMSEAGAGTGMIVGSDGYIMTNKHVIEGATTVSVYLTDGTSYDKVRIIGTDPLNDLAFLKIDNASNLPAVELGDSTSIRVGQSVVAIGNSLGQYQNTVTSGIISGVGRPISAQSGDTVENLNDLIQTDAAINPGNSGGPLLNLQGQVIGINTAIAQDAQGIGFAIPISAAKGMLKGVLAGKAVEHAFMGVNYVMITADIAKQHNLSLKKGAYVVSSTGSSPIVSGSPAEKAGLKDKDIITKVNNIEVGPAGDVASLVSEYAPGDTIQLTIVRDGREQTLNVTLAAYKA